MHDTFTNNCNIQKGLQKIKRIVIYTSVMININVNMLDRIT